MIGGGLLAGTRYRLAGEGPPLVLIHGVGMDLEMWQPVAERLAAHHQVVTYDMQGHGGSDKPPGPYSLEDFVVQLGRLAEGLGLQRFDLVGFSMGALVAQAFACASPRAVRRLVLLNGVYDRSQAERDAIAARVVEVLNGGLPRSVEAALQRWFTPAFAAAHPEVLAAVRARMLGNALPPYAAAYAVFGSADRDLVERLPSMPTLVATGSDDQRSTAAMARALAARLPQGRLQLLEGQRHVTPLEVPETLAALIQEFLAE